MQDQLFMNIYDGSARDVELAENGQDPDVIPAPAALAVDPTQYILQGKDLTLQELGPVKTEQVQLLPDPSRKVDRGGRRPCKKKKPQMHQTENVSLLRKNARMRRYVGGQYSPHLP
jgi:hypothetical protein